jgi:hypothetical protein
MSTWEGKKLQQQKQQTAKLNKKPLTNHTQNHTKKSAPNQHKMNRIIL